MKPCSESRLRTDPVQSTSMAWYSAKPSMKRVVRIIDPEIENKREAVMDIAGSALADLIDIEKEMPKLLEEIRTKKNEISAHMVQM